MIFDGDIQRLGDYILDVKHRMGLRDWTIDLVIDDLERGEHDVTDSNGEPVAEIDCMYGSKRAVLTLTPGWEQADPEMLRMVICHELVHAHLAITGWAVNNASFAMGKAAFDVFQASCSNAEEIATDSIAVAWAEMLPLPDATESEAEGELIEWSERESA